MSRIVANIDPNLLQFRPGSAERIIFSRPFILRELTRADGTPLPSPQQAQIADIQRDSVVRRLQRVLPVFEALKALKAAPRSSRTGGELQGLRRSNPYVALLEGKKTDVANLLAQAPDPHRLLKELASPDVGLKRLGVLQRALNGARAWEQLAVQISSLPPPPPPGNGDPNGNPNGNGPPGKQRPAISQIDPAEGMPGALVEISGAAFGAKSGQVLFRLDSAGSFAGTVQDWSDTSIHVLVPDVRSSSDALTGVIVARSVPSLRSEPADFTVLALPAPEPGPSSVGLQRSPIGYMFFDRTLVVPNGFVLGEHVYSLSLGPGEEVTLEQKSWTKREISLEDLVETEQEINLEQSSVLTTELQDGVTRQQTHDQAQGGTTTTNVGVRANVPLDDKGSVGIDLSNGNTTTHDLKDADSRTKTESTKSTFQRTSKVAAKYRALHKTTFKISTEVGFEATSKRIVRNPNPGSALDLHYFKILRSLQLTHERYGVRLCWTPFLRDPGFAVRERIQKAEEEAAARLAETLPLPPEPLAPATSKQPAQMKEGDELDLNDKFGFWNDMRVDVETKFDLKPFKALGLDWDGVNYGVSLNFSGNRSSHATVLGPPWREVDFVKARVHVGIDWTMEPGARGTASVALKLYLVPVQTPEEKKALDDYRTEVANWKKEVNRLQAEARQKATEQAPSLVDQVLAATSPISEMLGRIVETQFAPAIRDDFSEVAFWHSIFDFSAAGYALYPGWWSGKPLPYLERAPADFLNASWAQVCLPVRPGKENEIRALRFIYGNVIDQPLDQDHEDAFQRFVTELQEYRKQHFGNANEDDFDPDSGVRVSHAFTLAQWEETLPTDGTHVESVFASTSAVDEAGERAATLQAELQSALLEQRNRDVQLKDKAAQLMTAPKTTVVVATDEHG
jgi:hypothetical protein